MKETVEYMTFNAKGEQLGAVRGALFEHHGPHIFCEGGLIIQAADIVPAEGGPTKTVYVDISVLEV